MILINTIMSKSCGLAIFFLLLQSKLFRYKKRDSRYRKYIHYDRSDNISRTAYYFCQWRSLADVIGTIAGVALLGLPILKRMCRVTIAHKLTASIDKNNKRYD